MEETLDNNESQAGISQKMLQSLKGSAPWMKFIAIFQLVMLSLSVISMLLLISQAGFNKFVFIMLCMLGLGFYMSVLILQTGNGFSNYVGSKDPNTLESALESQRKFWMILGILLILYILLIVLVASCPECFVDMLQMFA